MIPNKGIIIIFNNDLIFIGLLDLVIIGFLADIKLGRSKMQELMHVLIFNGIFIDLCFLLYLQFLYLMDIKPETSLYFLGVR